MPHFRWIRGHLPGYFCGVLIVSLLIRLLFFAAMLTQVKQSKWEELVPDTYHYCQAANKITSGIDFDSFGVQTFGPGYPLFLALLHGMTGHSPIGMMLIQILLSSIVSAMMAAWAFRLTDDTRIAWIAGLLNALSFTAISLANIFLSETFFMSLVLGGALLLWSAMHRSRYWLAVLAGVFLGVAALTRSMGNGLPVVLLSLAFEGDRSGLAHRLKIGGVCLIMACALVISWSTFYNPETSRVTGAVPSAMFRIVRAIDVQQKNISMTEATQQFEAACQQHAMDSTGDYLVSQHILSIGRFEKLLKEEPIQVVSVILRNIRDNMHNEFSVIRLQIPTIDGIYETVRIFSARKGLNYRVTVLSLIGATILCFRRQWRVCLLLAVIFVYFALMSGFSDLQTSRIFYPAQIAWGILVSVTLLAMHDWMRSKISNHSRAITTG